MDPRHIHDILSGQAKGLGPGALRAGLALAAGPYAVAMRVRRWAYRRGVFASRSAGVPVISVGNITAGGTGKTPMVAWVVARLRELGRTPAILTRGYKAAAGVSDEAELLRRLTGAAVVVNADRVAAAASARELGADVCVLDDGFQHRRLRRDLDIVLIDATNPLGYGRCLPRGLLREPPAALRDAGAIVITRADAAGAGEIAALKARLASWAPRSVLATAIHAPTHLTDPAGRQRRELTELAGRRLLAFCALGNPEAFFATLRQLGATVVAHHAYEDHAQYSDAALAALRHWAAQFDATLVTTQKDAVKLADRLPDATVLAVEMRVREGEPELRGAIRACV